MQGLGLSIPFDLGEIAKRIAYAKARLAMGANDQAWAAILFGLPPTVHRPERAVKAPSGRIIQVEVVKGRVKTYSGALDRYGDVVRREAKAAGITSALGCAFAWVESTFDATAYRYEPGWDRRYVNEIKIAYRLDIEDPRFAPYVMKDITIEEWFTQNSRRQKERREGKNYKYFAQLRIAASYGLVQVMHSSAVGEGLKGKPESMFRPEVGVEIGFAHLNRKRRRKGYTLRDAIAAYNAGSARKRDDGTYKNEYYVGKIEKAQRAFKKIL